MWWTLEFRELEFCCVLLVMVSLMYFVMLPSHQSPIVSAYSRDQLGFFLEFLAISYDVPCHPQMDFLRGRPKCFSRYCRSTMERAADSLKIPLHIKEGSKEIKMDLVRHWEIVFGTNFDSWCFGNSPKRF